MLSCLPVGSDHKFDGKEMGKDVDNVCIVRTISRQIMQENPKLLVTVTSKDPVLTQVVLCERRLAKPVFRQALRLQETG